MERTLIKEIPKKIGKKVRLNGWIDRRRDHGKLVFIDLKDRTGLVQIVGKEKLGELRISDVVTIEGKVKKRPKDLINPKIPTGEIEVELEKIEILARSEDLPFDIRGDGYQIGEETRLKYRYLDLRRPRLVKNLEIRHRVIRFIRNWLDEKGFIEIETPILSKATPEGARDFLVPSRLQPGKFYALPQAPQQYKQLLMVAGFEKYYQIARCFRDEDPRIDRAYGEFTQLDLEMSFTTQEEILNLTEALFTEITEKVLKKKVFKKPFPRFSHAEAMKKFGSDKFDLRKKKDPKVVAFAWVIDFPLFEKTKERELSPSHHPFTAPKDEDLPLLDKDPMKARSWQHDLVCNGLEVGGGSIRITDPKIQRKIFKILGLSEKEIEKKFGHLLKAFEYGVPPHGGIAPGIDRFLLAALGERSVRELIAFPMTAGGQTSVMDAPGEVDEAQLKELKIKVMKK
ncbi:MAG TPA: aspartate--tRNA ligase [Patescibacteria group bacterium]|nr:aspartate--tRNA ligase [Patescibacteria group bacterium]